MSKTRMTVSLLGQLRNAARVMGQLRDDIRNMTGWDEAREAAGEDDPAGSADYYAFALGEVADHIAGVHKGEHDVAEFCEFYGLRPEAAPTPAPQPVAPSPEQNGGAK